MKNIWLVAVLFIWSEASYALFDLQLSLNRRWFYFTSGEEGQTDENYKKEVDLFSDTYTVAAHTDPLPKIPVSLGVSYAIVNYTSDLSYTPTDDYRDEVSEKGEKAESGEVKIETNGGELGVELAAWLPMVPVVTPWVKVKYLAWGFFTAKVNTDAGEKEQEDETKNEYTGWEAIVGIWYSPISPVTLSLETGYGQLIGKGGDQSDEEVSTTFDNDSAGYLPIKLGVKYAPIPYAAAFLQAEYGKVWYEHLEDDDKISFISLTFGIEGRI